MRKRTKRLKLSALLFALLLLFGCGSPSGQASKPAPRETSAAVPREDFTAYQPKDMATAVFHPELAEGDGDVRIDISAVREGYVAVSVRSENRLKFQVIKDDLTYTYNLASDGTPSIFPLQSGDGFYTFRVMENIGGTKYAQLGSAECEVKLLDEFQPFLRPNDYASYSAQSLCVGRAGQLASGCANKLEIVSAVYSFICSNIRYDVAKAATVRSGYLPDVDETISSGMGICFDYASLAAAMLRSQGIPTKIIIGYVSPDDLYHAWNMFYTEESGWVTVSFSVDGNTWNRIDLTFSASGADASFIGDGSNYTDVYSY